MTNEPPVTTNTLDVGVGVSGLTVGHSTPPISPLRQGDSDTFFDNVGFSFTSFHFSPFRVQDDSGDDAPATQ